MNVHWCNFTENKEIFISSTQDGYFTLFDRRRNQVFFDFDCSIHALDIGENMQLKKKITRFFFLDLFSISFESNHFSPFFNE